MSSEVDCTNVYVNKSRMENGGMGAFAKRNIQKGELVERGLVRRIECDGHKNPYLFTWSDDRTVWAFASGCATFYNTSLTPNTIMIRFFDDDHFEIYASRDIEADEELTHTYKSLNWRTCFVEDKNLH